MKNNSLARFINAGTILTLITIGATATWRIAQDNVRIDFLSQQVNQLTLTVTTLVSEVKELSFELRNKNGNKNK